MVLALVWKVSNTGPRPVTGSNRAFPRALACCEPLGVLVLRHKERHIIADLSLWVRWSPSLYVSRFITAVQGSSLAYNQLEGGPLVGIASFWCYRATCCEHRVKDV